MLVSPVAVSSTSKGSDRWDSSLKPKEPKERSNRASRSSRKPCEVNTVSQQPSGRHNKLLPKRAHQCCLGQSVPQEVHQLEKWDKFHKVSLKQRKVKVNELLICQLCIKHLADKEWYKKAPADYRGCGESMWN